MLHWESEAQDSISSFGGNTLSLELFFFWCSNSSDANIGIIANAVRFFNILSHLSSILFY